MTACLDADTVLELLAGRIAPDARVRAEKHVDTCAACQALVAELAQSSLASAQPPALRERYLLLEQLGQGGMGIVQRAVPVGGGAPVALKWMRLEEDPEMRERFRREAELARTLVHPNVVRTVDHGEMPDGALYIAMELLDGEDLARRIRRAGPLDVETATRVACAAADGLDAAHRAGVIHRDVKPANIFLCSDGGIKVLDFGLAVPVGGTRFTSTGVLVGTPSYMAPEQLEGRRDEDARTDVWALGATVWCALTGRPPFGPPGAVEQVMRILTDMPDPLPASVPASLRDVLLRALAKQRAERWQSMPSFADALRGRAVAADTVREAALAATRARAVVAPPPTTLAQTPAMPPATLARTAATPFESTRVQPPVEAPQVAGARSPVRPKRGGAFVAVVAGAALLGVVLGVIGIVTVVVLLARTDNGAAAPSAFTVHEGAGWRFSAPSDWVALPPSDGFTLIALAEPTGLGTVDGLQVALRTEPWAGSSTSWVADWRNMHPGSVRRSAPATGGNADATDLESTQNGMPQLERVAVVRGQVYNLSCSAGASSFESVRAVCDAILASFVVR